MFAKKPRLPNSRLRASISEDLHIGANTVTLLSDKLVLVLIVSKSLTDSVFKRAFLLFRQA